MVEPSKVGFSCIEVVAPTVVGFSCFQVVLPFKVGSLYIHVVAPYKVGFTDIQVVVLLKAWSSYIEVFLVQPPSFGCTAKQCGETWMTFCSTVFQMVFEFTDECRYTHTIVNLKARLDYCS